MKIELVSKDGNKLIIECESTNVNIYAPDTNRGSIDISEPLTIKRIDT